MDISVKKTRLEHQYDRFKLDYQKGIKKGVLLKIQDKQPDPTDPMNEYYDNYFMGAATYLNPNSLERKKQYDKIFYYFVECDPTDNKEYLGWLLNLYSQQLKDRVSLLKGFTDTVNNTDEINNFFEDLLTKVKETLEVFTLLKKTNVLQVKNRDIYQYKTINEFLLVIKPYMSLNDDGDVDVHTLTAKELQCIQNYVTNNVNDEDQGVAELVFENDKWVIVITHNKAANNIFGHNTTWCTAGTRYGNMFDGYHAKGFLFVLIKKGFGSKEAIQSNPENRLQFHFETDQFMDANDKRIKIDKFLNANNDIREYFKNYLIDIALPTRRRLNNDTNDIKYLLGLGYADELINILKKTKPSKMSFSGYEIEPKYINNIGEITSLKTLDFSECKLSELPESISKLFDLTELKFRSNPEITEIPKWIAELKQLEILDCSSCNIKTINDLSENKNLKILTLDFNSNLKQLPKNLGSLNGLRKISAAGCDIRTFDDDTIINCPLYLIDLHSNTNLKTINKAISKIPTIQVLTLDNTDIPNDTIKEMVTNGNGHINIIRYTELK